MGLLGAPEPEKLLLIASKAEFMFALTLLLKSLGIIKLCWLISFFIYSYLLIDLT